MPKNKRIIVTCKELVKLLSLKHDASKISTSRTHLLMNKGKMPIRTACSVANLKVVCRLERANDLRCFYLPRESIYPYDLILDVKEQLQRHVHLQSSFRRIVFESLHAGNIDSQNVYMIIIKPTKIMISKTQAILMSWKCCLHPLSVTYCSYLKSHFSYGLAILLS